MDVLMAGKGPRNSADQGAQGAAERASSALRRFSAEKPFFMNEDFTLVDCCVAPILWRLKEVDINLPEKTTRPLQKYMQIMFEREGFRASLTESELEMRE